MKWVLDYFRCLMSKSDFENETWWLIHFNFDLFICSQLIEHHYSYSYCYRYRYSFMQYIVCGKVLLLLSFYGLCFWSLSFPNDYLVTYWTNLNEDTSLKIRHWTKYISRIDKMSIFIWKVQYFFFHWVNLWKWWKVLPLLLVV